MELALPLSLSFSVQDANAVCGVRCAEIDLLEANTHAIHTTAHTAEDGAGNGAGLGGGGISQVLTPMQYGPPGSKLPHRPSVAFLRLSTAFRRPSTAFRQVRPARRHPLDASRHRHVVAVSCRDRLPRGRHASRARYDRRDAVAGGPERRRAASSAVQDGRRLVRDRPSRARCRGHDGARRCRAANGPTERPEAPNPNCLISMPLPSEGRLDCLAIASQYSAPCRHPDCLRLRRWSSRFGRATTSTGSSGAYAKHPIRRRARQPRPPPPTWRPPLLMAAALRRLDGGSLDAMSRWSPSDVRLPWLAFEGPLSSAVRPCWPYTVAGMPSRRGDLWRLCLCGATNATAASTTRAAAAAAALADALAAVPATIGSAAAAAASHSAAAAAARADYPSSLRRKHDVPVLVRAGDWPRSHVLECS